MYFIFFSVTVLFSVIVVGITYLSEKIANWLYKRDVFFKNEKLNGVCSVLTEKYKLKNLSKNKLKNIISTISIPMIVLFAIMIAASAIGGYINRWEITENSINKYNAFNTFEATYEYDSIDSYMVKSYKTIGGRYSRGRPAICMILKLKDGRKIKFDGVYMRDSYLGLIEIDKLLSDKSIKKEIESEWIDWYISYNNISAENEKMLRAVFEE